MSKFFQKYGFNNLQAKIAGVQNKFIEKDKNILIKNSYKTITSEEDLNNIINIIKEIGFFVIDTETDSIKPCNANLIGISLSWDVGQACYIPLAHSENQTGVRQLKKKQ